MCIASKGLGELEGQMAIFRKCYMEIDYFKKGVGSECKKN